MAGYRNVEAALGTVVTDGVAAETGAETGSEAGAAAGWVALEAGTAPPAADTPMALVKLSKGLRTAPPPKRSTCV